MSQKQRNGSIKTVAITFIVTTFIITTLVSGASAQLGLLSAPDVLGGDDDASVLQSIPEDSNFVARVDVAGLVEDETTDEIITSSSESFIDEENSVEDILKMSTLDATSTSDNQGQGEGQGQGNSDIEPDDLEETVVFGKIGVDGMLVDSNNYRAAIVEADAPPGQVLQLFYDIGEPQEESELNGVETWGAPNNDRLAVVEQGLYILGDKEAVEDAIDTAQGDKESIDDEFIPDIEGDTHAHMLLYDIGDFFGTFDAGNIEGLPVPSNAALTYTTTDENTAIIDIVTEAENDEELNDIMQGSEEAFQEYDEVDFNPQVLMEGGEMRFEISPEELEETTGALTSIISPNQQNIFNPPDMD